MTKRNNIALIVMFCAYIGIMAVLTAFLPKESVSVNEKRTLAKFPKLSADSLLSGKWEKGFEDYISDHFPAKNLFTGTDAYFMTLTGRNGSNGIYSGSEGCLFAAPVEFDESRLRKNIDAINAFAERTQVNTKLIIVPSAGYIMSEKLPPLHRVYRDGEIIGMARDMADSADFIDLTDVFLSSENKDSLYYRTDHHWTSEGAYTAYRVWAEGEGIVPADRSFYKISSESGFYGTSYSKSALWLTAPDTIEMWEYPSDVNVRIEDKDEYGSMFFKEHLTEPDKYPVYLDGNHGKVTVTNNQKPDGRKILVIKDSYAHCFVPFMVQSCSRVDMIDLRYYIGSAAELAEENNYDEILVLQGISSMCEYTDLAALKA